MSIIEAPAIGRTSIKGTIYNGDYNGTLGSIGSPPSKIATHTLRKWIKQGNIVDFNSSDNWPQGQPKFGHLTNGTRVGELGAAGYDFDGSLVVFNHLSEAELTEIAYVIASSGAPFRSAAFLPRFDRDSTHGVTMYIDPKEQDKDALILQKKYPQIDTITRNRDYFSRLLNSFQKQIGMVTFQTLEVNRIELLNVLQQLHLSQDTSGSIFITPHKVNKAVTLLRLLDEIYKRNPDRTIIVG